MIKPAIIISAYNREYPLIRLLNSLERASYELTDITLVISIDKNYNQNIKSIAEKFNWIHGEKQIINHKEHLGLKHHILYCLKKVEIFESIISSFDLKRKGNCGPQNFRVSDCRT